MAMHWLSQAIGHVKKDLAEFGHIIMSDTTKALQGESLDVMVDGQEEPVIEPSPSLSTIVPPDLHEIGGSSSTSELVALAHEAEEREKARQALRKAQEAAATDEAPLDWDDDGRPAINVPPGAASDAAAASPTADLALEVTPILPDEPASVVVTGFGMAAGSSAEAGVPRSAVAELTTTWPPSSDDLRSDPWEPAAAADPAASALRIPTDEFRGVPPSAPLENPTEQADADASVPVDVLIVPLEDFVEPEPQPQPAPPASSDSTPVDRVSTCVAANLEDAVAPLGGLDDEFVAPLAEHDDLEGHDHGNGNRNASTAHDDRVPAEDERPATRIGAASAGLVEGRGGVTAEPRHPAEGSPNSRGDDDDMSSSLAPPPDSPLAPSLTGGEEEPDRSSTPASPASSFASQLASTSLDELLLGSMSVAPAGSVTGPGSVAASDSSGGLAAARRRASTASSIALLGMLGGAVGGSTSFYGTASDLSPGGGPASVDPTLIAAAALSTAAPLLPPPVSTVDLLVGGSSAGAGGFPSSASSPRLTPSGSVGAFPQLPGMTHVLSVNSFEPLSAPVPLPYALKAAAAAERTTSGGGGGNESNPAALSLVREASVGSASSAAQPTLPTQLTVTPSTVTTPLLGPVGAGSDTLGPMSALSLASSSTLTTAGTPSLTYPDSANGSTVSHELVSHVTEIPTSAADIPLDTLSLGGSMSVVSTETDEIPVAMVTSSAAATAPAPSSLPVMLADPVLSLLTPEATAAGHGVTAMVAMEQQAIATVAAVIAEAQRTAGVASDGSDEIGGRGAVQPVDESHQSAHITANEDDGDDEGCVALPPDPRADELLFGVTEQPDVPTDAPAADAVGPTRPDLDDTTEDGVLKDVDYENF